MDLQKKILIVDDEKDILEVVQYILIQRGFTVFTHTSGLQVSEAVQFYHPDLILLDIGLPGKSGTDVCMELKKAFSMPILLFSALAEKCSSYKEYNADGCILKPFDINKLVSDVSAYVN
jgi:DNA-binding response OmpR family regulator